MATKRIYLDNAATTPVDPSVLKAMLPYFTEHFENASSPHSAGQLAMEAVDKARKEIADSINADSSEVIFTSGATESNNIAIKGVVWAARKGFTGDKKAHIITTKIEHDGVLNVFKWLEKQGCAVTYLNVDKEGFADIKQLEKNLTKDTILVSVMHANNEIGTIENIAEIGRICRNNNIYFHSDACSSYMKVPIDVKAMNLDMLTLSAHKIYGPKGIGALYIRKGVKLETWLHGGGHEFGKRSGTENVPGMVGFAAAVKLNPKVEHMRELQKYMHNQIMQIKDVIFNGPEIGNRRIPDNLSFSFKYIEGEGMMLLLDEAGVIVSTGSACSSHTLDTSHVLKAIGARPVDANGTIRISLGRHTTKADIDYAVDAIRKVVAKLRKLSPFKRTKDV